MGREWLLIIGKHSKDLPSLVEVNFPDPDQVHKPGGGGGGGIKQINFTS